jgi:hypothetical protein
VSADPTRSLIAQLVGDLTPVKPVPPLWLALTLVLAAAAPVALAAWGMQGLRNGPWLDFSADPAFAGVLIGLAAIAVGGCVAGLASAIPGRGAAAISAAALATSGALLAIGVSAAISLRQSGQPLGLTLADPPCIAWAVVFSALPVAAGIGLCSRGWAARPSLTAALTLLGAGAIGALLVHATCPVVEARHLLLGHCSTPLLLSAAGAVLLGPWLRRRAR